MFSERTQVLLRPDQRERLDAAARRRGMSVGAVIREAVDAYFGPRSRTRADAIEALFAMEAPVEDWDVMKAEIERGALGSTGGRG